MGCTSLLNKGGPYQPFTTFCSPRIVLNPPPLLIYSPSAENRSMNTGKSKREGEERRTIVLSLSLMLFGIRIKPCTSIPHLQSNTFASALNETTLLSTRERKNRKFPMDLGTMGFRLQNYSVGRSQLILFSGKNVIVKTNWGFKVISEAKL